MNKTLGYTAIFGLLFLAGCERPADVASRNISKAADNFEIVRSISFMNGITGKEDMRIVGLCSIGNDSTATKLPITCKEPDGGFKKHYLFRSDNVYAIVAQLETVDVSTFHTRWYFRPQAMIPDVDFQFDARDLITDQNEGP